MIIKTRATKIVKVLNNEVIWERVSQSITVSLDDESSSLSDLDGVQDKIIRALTRLGYHKGTNDV